MYISLPLCRILTFDELKGVLAHELGHFKGLDTRFSRRFYPIYRGASEALTNIASAFSEKGGAGQIVLWPACVTLSYFLGCFSESEAEISRDRELAADCEAANVAGGDKIASALAKIHAFSNVWPAIKDHMKDQVREGKVLINGSTFFAAVVSQMDRTDALASISEDGPIHPTDTHPPLRLRLANVNFSLEQVTGSEFNKRPERPAIGLLENAEILETELTEIEQSVMIERGEAIPNEQASAAPTS
jgi:Zn-dependent protease with chaperone function